MLCVDDWHVFEATFRPPSKTGSSARPLSKQTFPRSPSLSPKRSLPLEEEAGTNVDRLRQSESSKPGTTPQPPFRKTAILNTGVPSAAHPRPREFDRTSQTSSSSSSTSDAPIHRLNNGSVLIGTSALDDLFCSLCGFSSRKRFEHEE
ncbi:hypothetical protein NMY22_g18293 [Coprinellus aureogranulatus]|nr:hypothetical protein NMY22_g18293 [Coprinellus aureogranulatus]